MLAIPSHGPFKPSLQADRCRPACLRELRDVSSLRDAIRFSCISLGFAGVTDNGGDCLGDLWKGDVGPTSDVNLLRAVIVL